MYVHGFDNEMDYYGMTTEQAERLKRRRESDYYIRCRNLAAGNEACNKCTPPSWYGHELVRQLYDRDGGGCSTCRKNIENLGKPKPKEPIIDDNRPRLSFPWDLPDLHVSGDDNHLGNEPDVDKDKGNDRTQVHMRISIDIE